MDGALLGWCQGVAAAVRSLGWQPSLGATGSKFGASVAGQIAWQNAALLLAPAAQRAFLAGQPVATLPLDADAVTQLRHLGIRTLGQYTRLPATGVLARFGQAGRTAQRWAQGLDDRPVVPPWECPEVSARIEFEPPLADRERLLAALVQPGRSASAPAPGPAPGDRAYPPERHPRRWADVPVGHTFPLPTAAAEPVRLALASLLTRAPWDGQGVIEVTLTLAGITDAPGQQLTLFDTGEIGGDSRARLTATLDRLAARFGADAFRLADLTDPDHLLPERRAAFAALAVTTLMAGGGAGPGGGRTGRDAAGLPVAWRVASGRYRRQPLAGAGQLVDTRGRGLAGVHQADHNRWPALHPGP